MIKLTFSSVLLASIACSPDKGGAFVSGIVSYSVTPLSNWDHANHCINGISSLFLEVSIIYSYAERGKGREGGREGAEE